jgi:hypothetical protein
MRDAGDRRLDLIGGDQPAAFELPRRSFVAWAAHEIALVERQVPVVPD